MAETSMRELLRVAPGEACDLLDRDPRGTPGAPGGKRRTAEAWDDLVAELAELQECLFAEATAGGRRAVLLVLQGMDSSGKGGTIEHVAGLVNPLGLHIASFKKPTPEELEHHFLWRIRRQVPRAGMIGIFDRSHYEDVLVVRVHDLVPQEQWEARYGEIVAFEDELAAADVTVVKCMLHISPQEQHARLLARLDDPTKHWKFNPGDIDERRRWPAYMEAYEAALTRCSTASAPWYVVPADRKWFRNYAIARLLLETLRELAPAYPAREDLDIPALRARLEAEG